MQENKRKITKFQKKVFNEVKKIKKGKVKTYKQIAEKLNTSPRAIGQALKRNPYAPIVPCHRVISSTGEVGGYSGVWNSNKKIKMLKKEGVNIKNKKVIA